MRYFIGADTGGTFTDLAIIDDAGNLSFDKALSNREDPSRGVLDALANGAALLGREVPELAAATARFAHGTTVGTNALIERRGARVGLICTQGFEDTILIARGALGRNLGVPIAQALDFIHNENPPPLVPRARIRGVGGRVSAQGEQVSSLDEEEVVAALRELAAEGVDSIAVCLLWAFRNPADERRVKALAADTVPDIPVSISSDVSPVLGEFERTLTTAVNAYIGPPIKRYVQRLDRTLRDMGLGNAVQVMKCSGGLTLPDNVESEAVAIVNSGPVGGLVASKYVSEMLGYSNVVTSDMGGTSFDVGVIRDGDFEYEREPCLDQGLPVQTPAVKVVTIGAGGGSIAWTDGERLFVGPQSAGADPGPACYGVGEEPTVTDVLVVLGILSPDNFFGGRKRLDERRAHEAIRRKVAEPLGMSVQSAAEGIYEIVTARMGDLIRKVTVENGHDPRNFALLAYGGAGPAHAALYARDLGMRDVIIPPTSSVFSALGCALSDVKYSYARSEPLLLREDAECVETFNAVFDELITTALADIEASGHPASEAVIRRTLDIRYSSQMNELNVDWPDEPLTAGGVQLVRKGFEKAYAAKYGAGTTRAESPLEVMTFRIDAVRRTDKPVIKPEPLGPADPSAARKGSRVVSLRHVGALDHAVYDGTALAPGHAIDGPAIIERPDTTIFLPHGHAATVDEYRNVRIRPRNGGQP